MEQIVIYLLMVQKLFKAKDSEIAAYPMCLGYISKEWSVDNKKKTGLKGYFYDFSVGCNAIAVPDILDIHKHLVKMNGIVCLGL